ncbi:dethiobiotin synthase [bacterium]|nr:dethiobiotin synthase [bacterium]
MSKNIFITGVGTDVGKTYVTALIVKYLKDLGYKSGYYKAAVSGNERINGELVAGDAKYVKDIANLSENPNDMVSYIYEEAISPHLAAIREKEPVEIEKVRKDFKRVCENHDFVTVEGSGGILCPIRYDDKKIWLEDIIKELNLSTIIVANAKLGSINATGLTVSYLKSKNIPIKGIILNNFDENDFMEKDNKKMIEELTGVKILACVKDNAKTIEIKGLEDLYE